MQNSKTTIQLFIEMVSKRELTKQEADLLQHLLAAQKPAAPVPDKVKAVPSKIDTPVTQYELLQGGWWCRDVCDEARKAFQRLRIVVSGASAWGKNPSFRSCELFEKRVIRAKHLIASGKEIVLKDGNFYWKSNT